MPKRIDDDESRPLPREWLPDPTASADAAEWQVRVRRVVTMAEPALAELAHRGAAAQARGPMSLGRWWKPAAVLATAAAALLIIHDAQAARAPAARSSLALSIVAADGEPAALWDALGVDADPVLALMAMQESPQ